MDIVRENLANCKETTKDLLAFRFKKVFIDNHKAPNHPSFVDPPEGGKTAA